MSEATEKQDLEVTKLFQELRRTELEAPAFLETRVLARLEERRKGKGKFLFWRWTTASAGLFSLALAVLLFTRPTQSDFHAFVHKPFVVRVSVSDLGNAAIARAEITLPDGVYFDIEEFPDLRTHKVLSLKWSEKMGTELVPFILNSTERGTKTVTVRFFSADDALLQEKKIIVNLREEA